MRRRRSLERMRDAAVGRTQRLREIAERIAGQKDEASSRLASYLAIEAYTTWVNFSREFYLACAYLRPRSVNGITIENSACNIVDEESALRDAIPRARGSNAKVPAAGIKIAPRFEPDWSQRHTLIKLSVTLSNSQSILQGLSLQTTLFQHLPTVRIFYAHRQKSTFEKVKTIAMESYGVPDINHPTDLVNNILPGRSKSLLMEWIADIQTISEDMCA